MLYNTLKKITPTWLKIIVREWLWSYRRLTWRWRISPDFLIVGTMKSGTTSLHAYLAQHPELQPSHIKEVHFFDDRMGRRTMLNFEKGEAWYRAHFPLQTNTNHRAFETTPSYTFYPPATQRIFAFNPKIKLIMLLRNPTERAISHYFHSCRMGMESLPIMEALQAEDDEPRQKTVMCEQDYSKQSWYHPSYKRRGLYTQQIKRFLDYFPEEQLLVLSSELFFKHPERILKQIFEFVGVAADFKVRDLIPHHVGTNKTAVDPEVRQYLNDYFLPHNKQLYELIGRDFGWDRVEYPKQTL